MPSRCDPIRKFDHSDSIITMIGSVNFKMLSDCKMLSDVYERGLEQIDEITLVVGIGVPVIYVASSIAR